MLQVLSSELLSAVTEARMALNEGLAEAQAALTESRIGESLKGRH